MKDDGGPAFPGKRFETEPGMGTAEVTYPGMSLRDAFALAIIGGMVSDPGFTLDVTGAMPGEQRAGVAYMLADAMLAERAKP